MSLKKLANPGAFGQGADLWVIPDPKNSPWARKIDWYLNLQIQRAKNHKSKKIPDQLKEILAANELDLPDFDIKGDTPLLVNSHNHLPTRSVLHVPMSKIAENWVAECHSIWMKLSKPTVRFFLPEEISDDIFENQWPKDQQAGVSFVSSQSPLEE